MDREKLFVEKLSILNDNFVRFIQRAHREHPAADFSPTVQDYLKYVAELDCMYYVKEGNSFSSMANPPVSIGVETTVSKNSNNDGVASSPAASKRPAPPFSFGAAPLTSSQKTLENGDCDLSTPKILPQPISFQGVSSKSSDIGKAASSPNASKGLAAPILFDVAPSKSNENLEKANASSSAAKRPTGTLLFGTQKTSTPNAGEKTGKDAAPWAAKATILGFSFGGTATKQNGNSSSASTAKSSVPMFTFSAPSTQQPSATSMSENNDNSGDEQEEPPKPETIDHSEEGAICSVKCACFHLIDGEYKKLGVAFASIKSVQEADGKGERKQLIIRASNALGNVWTNTYIDDKFQWRKAKEKNLRITYPKTEDDGTPSGTTVLLRVGSEEDEKKLTDVFEKK